MRKLSDELARVIESNDILQFGMYQRLFNLSALAAFLVPLLAAKTKKALSTTAVVMSLSRYQRSQNQRARPVQLPEFRTRDLSVKSGLCVATFNQSPEVRRQLNSFSSKLHTKDHFVTVTHGMRESTLICDNADIQNLSEHCSTKPASLRRSVGCLSIHFEKRYGEIPGFLYTVFQQLYFQRINVIEIASTTGELIVYVDEKDLRLAFDTIFNRFSSAER